MGNVKDWYFCYADNGDQFVGRCLALLPILSADLAISPPYFKEHSDFKWIADMVSFFACVLPLFFIMKGGLQLSWYLQIM
jgi:hypothetical protein